MFFNHILLTYLLLFLTLGCPYVNSMTREQMKKSAKLMKKTCMPKNNVTEDQIGDIDKGKFLEERNVMCYIACVYGVSGIIKNNKILLEALVKQVDMMFPPEMKDPVKATIEKCKGVGKKFQDICEASYWTAKCMCDEDPSNFVFA